MVKLSTDLDRSYTSAVLLALAQQLVVGVFCALMLDLGALSRLFAVTLLGFWAGVAIIAFRRPTKPTSRDLLAIRWGSIPLFLLAFAYVRHVLGIY